MHLSHKLIKAFMKFKLIVFLHLSMAINEFSGFSWTLREHNTTAAPAISMTGFIHTRIKQIPIPEIS
jgi:hypothetical protein